MPDLGAASVNDVCELLTPFPVTVTSYLPGASEPGSFNVRVHLPLFALKVLLNAVFFPPCLRTEIGQCRARARVPERVSVPTRWLAFQAAFSFGFATVVGGVGGGGGTGAFVITICRVVGAEAFPTASLALTVTVYVPGAA